MSDENEPSLTTPTHDDQMEAEEDNGEGQGQGQGQEGQESEAGDSLSSLQLSNVSWGPLMSMAQTEQNQQSPTEAGNSSVRNFIWKSIFLS